MKGKLLFLAALLVVVSCSKDEGFLPDEPDVLNDKGFYLKSQAIIDGNVRHQTIDGFGFSDGWCGDLTNAKENALYNTLGLNILRAFKFHPDYKGGYNTPDANLTSQNHMELRCCAPIGLLKNGRNSSNHLDPGHYYDYANWIKNNVNNIDIVSPFNEPDFDNAIEMTGAEIRTFIKYYCRDLSNTRPILVSEASSFHDSYTDPVLDDFRARGRVTYIGGHFYGNGNFKHTKALNYGKRVWQTEHCIPNSYNNHSKAMKFAKELSDAMHNSFSAYCWWWVRDNPDDGTQIVLNDGTIYKNGYILGQFAKFIRPGKQRIRATYNPTSGVYVTAYRNNGLVVVAVNTTSKYVWQTFKLENVAGVSSLTVHRTTNSMNMQNVGVATVSNNTFGLYMPPQSVSTAHQY